MILVGSGPAAPDGSVDEPLVRVRTAEPPVPGPTNTGSPAAAGLR